MLCQRILTKDLDFNCQNITGRYIQQVKFINHADLEEYYIEDNHDKHRIKFKLKSQKRALRFDFPVNGNSVVPKVAHVKEDGITQYTHTLEVPIFGVTEQIKCTLKELEKALYFAVVRYSDNTLEVYGFHNGLQANEYDLDLANNKGGTTITLKNDDNEFHLPYIYINNGREIQDFDNDFQNVSLIIRGDFNNDFNNDFYNL